MFHGVWLAVADETPDPMPSTIEALTPTLAWNRFMSAAQTALAVFEGRGRFNEEAVQRFDQ
jgi:hypothetical protein